MGKSQQHVAQRRQRAGAMFARKQASQVCATVEPSDAQDEAALFNQYEVIFESLPDGVLVCDQAGIIRQINVAALRLFEVPTESRCQGRGLQEFLEHYALYDERQRLLSSAHWLMLHLMDETGSAEQIMMFQAPSGRRVSVSVSCAPVLDARKHIKGTVFVFHEHSQRYQQALHLQRVHEAVSTLTEAISHLPERIPEQVTAALPEGSFLMSPPVVFIAQQLVNVIRQVLSCHRASLKALGQADRVYYVAGSGFTAEQEAPERVTSGLITLSEILEEAVVHRLYAKKEVIISGDRVHFPPGLESLTSLKILLMPLFLEQRFVGMLCILKEGVESVYTPEEIALVRAVADQATLVVECLNSLHAQAEEHTRELVLHEVRRLSNDFLILASHELRTPLTGILGNLQLAQRRLEALNSQEATRPERVSEHIAHASQPLASASQSARIQQRMINDIIDDARIQANQLELHLQHCDLDTLLTTVVTEQQRSRPEHKIALEKVPTGQGVPVLADIERVKQVFNTYLTNALNYSPANEPVIVRVAVEDSVARVSVHNEGPGIPAEEQGRLWDRFYRARGSSVQHELDLSLGLGLYLCRTLIEKQSGHVGVRSTPGHGATFWFTLPIAPPLET